MTTQQQHHDIQSLMMHVGRFQRDEQQRIHQIEIEEKSMNQLVSHVDIESEKMLVEGLQKITPGCGFITEEETTFDDSKSHQWIIDPLDGTTNYLFNHAIYSISIAYQIDKKTVFGAIYAPALNEYFSANQNGAFLNGIPIHVSRKNTLKESLIATGFPYYNFDQMDEYILVLKHLMRETKGVRRMGSAAIDLAYTAMGRFDCFYELNLNAWDIAAGAFIVQQAGGIVSDFKGLEGYDDGKRIIAGNDALHAAVLDLVQQHGM